MTRIKRMKTIFAAAKPLSLSLVLGLAGLIGCSNATEPSTATASDQPAPTETTVGVQPVANSAEPSAETEPATPDNQDGEWGNISGQIIVQGEPPANPPEPVGNNADKAVCLVDGKVPLDDNIVVSKDGGLRDVLVFMYLGRGEEDPEFHPSYADKKDKAITIDNVKCRFEPHVLFVRPDQTFTLKNSDAIGHNCHIITFNNEHNINLPPNGSVDLKLTESDTSPGKVVCDVHAWMDAVIFVRENPYVAITDADGKFTMENVPAGNWNFKFWHVKTGWQKDLEISGKEVSKRGQVELEVENGKTLELGKMNLPAAAFK